MILNFDEESPAYGNMAVNDGTFWRSRPVQKFSQITPVTLTAAATASVVSTTSAAGNPNLNPGDLNRLGATLIVKFGGYLTTAASGEGNITFGIYLAGGCVATTKATALAASQTTIGYYGEVRLTTTAVGSSGTTQPTGFIALASNSAVLDPVFTAGTTIGTQVPGTPPTVNFTVAFLVDVQSVLSAGVNTLVHTNTTFEIVF